MACLYWIHLPEHDDVFSEGYIGVTKNTAEFRFQQHIKDSKRTENGKYHFSRAIRKYGEKLIVNTLVISTEEYCYDLEFKLRPENYIGWNMSAGGRRPVRNENSYGETWKSKLRTHNLGKKHSQETLDKISKISLDNWAKPEYVEKMRENCNSNKTSVTPTPQFWKNKNSRNRLIPIADKLYNAYFENQNAFTKEILEELNIDVEKELQNARRLFRKFRGGWNPNKDELWLKDFNKECGNGT